LQSTHRHGILDKSRQIFNGRLFNPDEVTVVIRLTEKAEVDEMWSFVGKQHEPRWLCHVMDHRSGHVLAPLFERHKDTGFLMRKSLLEPFGSTRYERPALGVHTRVIAIQTSTSRANATRSRSSGSI
jgi:insertion element IS1 protein InsB